MSFVSVSGFVPLCHISSCDVFRSRSRSVCSVSSLRLAFVSQKNKEKVVEKK